VALAEFLLNRDGDYPWTITGRFRSLRRERRGLESGRYGALRRLSMRRLFGRAYRAKAKAKRLQRRRRAQQPEPSMHRPLKGSARLLEVMAALPGGGYPKPEQRGQGAEREGHGARACTHNCMGQCPLLGVSRTLFAVMPVLQALLQFSGRKNRAGVDSRVNNQADPASHRNRRWHHGDQNAQCDVIEGVSENVHGVVPASSPR